MKAIQKYKIISNLNKLIKSGEIPKPKNETVHYFDVEHVSFTIKCPNYDLSIRVTRKTSPIYKEIYAISLNDPQYKLVNKQNVADGRLVENNSELARLVFNRLEKFYHKKTK